MLLWAALRKQWKLWQNTKKSFSTYLFFASTIVGQCQELLGVRAIGMDGEQALIDVEAHDSQAAKAHLLKAGTQK